MGGHIAVQWVTSRVEAFYDEMWRFMCADLHIKLNVHALPQAGTTNQECKTSLRARWHCQAHACAAAELTRQPTMHVLCSICGSTIMLARQLKVNISRQNYQRQVAGTLAQHNHNLLSCASASALALPQVASPVRAPAALPLAMPGVAQGGGLHPHSQPAGPYSTCLAPTYQQESQRTSQGPCKHRSLLLRSGTSTLWPHLWRGLRRRAVSRHSCLWAHWRPRECHFDRHLRRCCYAPVLRRDVRDWALAPPRCALHAT